MAGTPWLWLAFLAGIFLLQGLEFRLSARRPQAMALRQAAFWSGMWIAASLLFNLILWWRRGPSPALDFFTGYLIEYSLSVDNLLVFVLIFRYFAVEPRYQARVLFWGVYGALALRVAMIGAGIALLQRFTWMFDALGAFLLYAGIRMLLRGSPAARPEHNRLLRLARRVLPVTEDYHGEDFFVQGPQGWRVTPLLLVLLAIESADLLFAMDSIPAVFSITREPFIVFSSNVCAVLGLRALYFLVAGALPRLRYLATGLSLVLLFIAAKMLLRRWVHIATPVSLLVVGAILVLAIAASLWHPELPPGGAAAVQ